MANSIDPDETAHFEPSHLDLLCLQSICHGLQVEGFMVIPVHLPRVGLDKVVRTLLFSLVCAIRTVCHGLFALPFDVLGRLYRGSYLSGHLI